MVKRDLLSSVPTHRAALCRAFLGITGDGHSKPLCHSSGEKKKKTYKENQTEKPDLQNEEVIPATVHLALGHQFMMSKTTYNPTTLSPFCPCKRFPARKQQPCLPRYTCQSKVHYGSIPHLPSPTQVWAFPPRHLICLFLVDHKPCG